MPTSLITICSLGFQQSEIDQLKIWYSAYPKEPGVDCGNLAMNRKAIQNDDSDQQQPGSTSRDMGSDGTILVVDRDISLHRSFEVQLFQNPLYDPDEFLCYTIIMYAILAFMPYPMRSGVQDNDNDYPIRMVLSSYYFDLSLQTYGVPDGKSNCDECTGPFCNQCEGRFVCVYCFDIYYSTDMNVN